RHLPHTLVDAFQATLEETVQADLLLHVIDAGSPDRDAQIAAVNSVLAEIGAAKVPQIMVFNKIDRTALPARAERDEYARISRLWLSALTGDGVDLLRTAIREYALDARSPSEPAVA
ncbi:MAG: GTP-binding protein HflX, partial [Proteobacteria bacterium]|nr:GTP-binding protein HflX [Pseudomonadota bacterium]